MELAAKVEWLREGMGCILCSDGGKEFDVSVSPSVLSSAAVVDFAEVVVVVVVVVVSMARGVATTWLFVDVVFTVVAGDTVPADTADDDDEDGVIVDAIRDGGVSEEEFLGMPTATGTSRSGGCSAREFKWTGKMSRMNAATVRMTVTGSLVASPFGTETDSACDNCPAHACESGEDLRCMACGAASARIGGMAAVQLKGADGSGACAGERDRDEGAVVGETQGPGRK